MKKLLVISFLITCFMVFFGIFLVYAEIPVYCPRCKKLLYNYQRDEVIKGGKVNPANFKSANSEIIDLIEIDELICPFDRSPLNGWLYWAKLQNFKSFTLAYPAISLLSKDKEGNWIWVGDDMPYLNMNEVKQ